MSAEAQPQSVRVFNMIESVVPSHDDNIAGIRFKDGSSLFVRKSGDYSATDKDAVYIDTLNIGDEENEFQRRDK